MTTTEFTAELLNQNPALRYIVVSTSNALTTETLNEIETSDRQRLAELCQQFTVLLLDPSVSASDQRRILARLIMCLLRLLTELPDLTHADVLMLGSSVDAYIDFTNHLRFAELQLAQGTAPLFNLNAAYTTLLKNFDRGSAFGTTWEKILHAAQ